MTADNSRTRPIAPMNIVEITAPNPLGSLKNGCINKKPKLA